MLSFNAPSDKKENISAARSKSIQTLTEHDKLFDEVHHLKMLIESIWNLLKEKTKLTDEELKEELKQIKFKHAEAAAKSEPGTCMNCGKAIAQESQKCVFCGEAQVKERFF